MNRIIGALRGARKNRKVLTIPVGASLLVVGLLATAIGLVACTNNTNEPTAPSITNSSTPMAARDDKAAVCKFYADMNAAGESADTPTEALAVFKTFQPRYEQAVADAPATIKPAVQTMVVAARNAVHTNDISVISDDSSVEAAVDQLDAYCADSSPK